MLIYASDLKCRNSKARLNREGICLVFALSVQSSVVVLIYLIMGDVGVPFGHFPFFQSVFLLSNGKL